MIAILLVIGCSKDESTVSSQASETSSDLSSAFENLGFEFQTLEIGSEEVLSYKENGLYGLISSDMTTVITEPIYENISEFSDGLTIAKLPNEYSYLDENGTIILTIPEDGGTVEPFVDGLAKRAFPRKKDSIEYYAPLTATFDIETTNPTIKKTEFTWNIAYFPIPNSIYGYIDKSGSFVIPPFFMV